jgi:hypothetical protein
MSIRPSAERLGWLRRQRHPDERKSVTRQRRIGILSALTLAIAAAAAPALLTARSSAATAAPDTRPAAVTAGAASGPRSGAGAPAAVEGFDEAGVSTGLGDNFTTSNWRTIRRDGFRLFLTDPIEWSSECSDGNCTAPVNTCTVDPAAVAQLQDAYSQGIDYAVYTRNVNCLTAAIEGLPAALQAHLSFALLDIEPGPSVPLTQALINGVTALGQTPVVYSYQWGWQTVMGTSSAFSSYPLQDGEVPDWSAQFPAAYPSGYPSLAAMPYPYGGWTGYDAQIEQQQCCTDIQGPAGSIDSSADQIDLDSVNAAWLASLRQA